MQLCFSARTTNKKLILDDQSSHQCLLSIFTVMISSSRIYIVASLKLIQAIQKQSKGLAFPPVEAKFASKVCDSSTEAHNILMQNVNSDEGE